MVGKESFGNNFAGEFTINENTNNQLETKKAWALPSSH